VADTITTGRAGCSAFSATSPERQIEQQKVNIVAFGNQFPDSIEIANFDNLHVFGLSRENLSQCAAEKRVIVSDNKVHVPRAPISSGSSPCGASNATNQVFMPIFIGSNQKSRC
jgi:hypothetical protein